MAQRLRIRVEGYDHEMIDQAARQIVQNASRSNTRVRGPIPLPTRIERYTVLRSPHADKKSREQFEIRTHKRLIELLDPQPKTIEDFKGMNLPAGVQVRVKVILDEK